MLFNCELLNATLMLAMQAVFHDYIVRIKGVVFNGAAEVIMTRLSKAAEAVAPSPEKLQQADEPAPHDELVDKGPFLLRDSILAHVTQILSQTASQSHSRVLWSRRRPCRPRRRDLDEVMHTARGLRRWVRL